MSAQSNAQKQQDDYENKDILAVLLSKTKQYIFHRNYLLTSKSSANYLYAVIINTIMHIQFYIALSIPQYNIAITEDSDVYFLVEKGIFFLFKLNVETELNLNSMTIIILGTIQLLLIASYFIPISSKQLNIVLSKYFIQTFSTITFVPAIFIGTQNLLNSQSIYISLLTLILTLINRLMLITMHFQFSIQGLGQNILIRNPLSTSKEILTFLLFVFFLLCSSFLYPMSLMLYLICNMAFCLNEVKDYCIGFTYHHEAIPKLVGILKIMKISISLCYLIVIATQITLVKNNILTFIAAFFVFFANFFLIFKKYSTKSIVIDSEDSSETKKILFIMWYFNCFRNRAEKKNQLYLSSLLKNHSTECLDLSCCCRKRLNIYDPSRNTFGSPTSQPHQDQVYIKHFFLKLLTATYKEFPKCNEILFLLAIYNLEILNFIPQTIELIKELKKKSLKKNLTFSQDYLLYCLGQRCYSKINEINQDRGNLNLEEVRKFDLKILQLKETIKFSVQTFASLWKTICSEKYNQKNLVEICKVALEVMFKIQETYKGIKSINNVSTELKELMVFYSKSVAHDIHLLSEVRKDIKLNGTKTVPTNLTEIKGINIFSPDTITLITSEICNIRWASKNCYSIFGYNDREEFLKLKINDLMPKFFSENHDNYINKWLQTGYSTKLNKSTYLWGSTKEGYCFSLALYIKIIPLEKEQDFAFFAAIEKIDIDNEIICNDEGQILGSGKLFASTIKCSQKTIQDYRPNIQIFIPTSFEIFLEKFYQEKKISQQLMVEVRRQGYFPMNLETILKDISKQKQAFMAKNSRKAEFGELLCGFLKQKMQQITVYMDGQYISFISTVHQLPVLENKKKKIIVFKLTGFKKNNVQKYYNDLEKMIVKLEQAKNENNSIKKKKSVKDPNKKEVKKDYFKMLLNPKRVKRILQQEDDQRFGADDQNLGFDRLNAITRQPQMNLSRGPKREMDRCIVDAQRIIGFRKKLALNAQDEIKCERAKYNIWRIKKSLFDQGIFSRYTYSILVGKGNVFETMHQTFKANEMYDDPFTTLNNNNNNIHIEEEQNSEENLSSENLTNKLEADNADKPNDNETFNSATSSAAFISMTNSIKMFKIKLRSLNTPKLLYWLNVGLIFLILLMAGFGVWLELQEMRQTELGQIYFTKGVQSTWAMDGLLMSKLLIQKLQHLNNNEQLLDPDFFNQTQQQLNRMIGVQLNLTHQILSVQLFEYSQLQSKDPSLLHYLFLKVPKNQTLSQNSTMTSLQVIQFMMREQDFGKKLINVRNEHEIDYLLQQHQAVFEENIYYRALEQMDQNLFFGGLVAFIVALAISIPIVYKIESKVEEIMYLISKISLNQRKKYYLQFTLLSEQLKNMNETQTWGDLQGLQQLKMNTLPLRVPNSEDMFSEQKSSEKSPLLPQNQQKALKTKFYSTIYFKIIVIYLVYLVVYSTKFVYVKVIFDEFLVQNDVFTNILTEKLRMTDQALHFNQVLLDNDTSGLNIRESRLVEEIYSSYHLEQKGSYEFDDYIDNLTTSDICIRIQDQLSEDKHPNYYLRFFMLSQEQQVLECQQLSNSSLSKGLFGTLDFIKQKRLDIISQPLQQRQDFSISQQAITLQKLTYYSNTMVYLIQNELRSQVNHKKGKLMFQMGVWLLIVAGVLLLFTIAWIFIYLNIAQRASYINAFLLLIPYQVLSQNPYIKLYIKNEFDYKASVY